MSFVLEYEFFIHSQSLNVILFQHSVLCFCSHKIDAWLCGQFKGICYIFSWRCNTSFGWYLQATPLLLTLAVIELSDIAFAVGSFQAIFICSSSFFYFMTPGICINISVIQIDSIPAVFGVTRDPLIILSSNIFAIAGKYSAFSVAILNFLYAWSKSYVWYNFCTSKQCQELTWWKHCYVRFAVALCAHFWKHGWIGVSTGEYPQSTFFFKVYCAIFYLPFDIEYLYFIYFLLLSCFITNKSFRFTSPIVKIRSMLVVIGGIGYLLLTNIQHYQLPLALQMWMVNARAESYIALWSNCTTYFYWQFALQPAIGIVLGFIGTKMTFDFFGEQLKTLSNSYFVTFIFSMLT